jgi:FkbM family methyltransferase
MNQEAYMNPRHIALKLCNIQATKSARNALRKRAEHVYYRKRLPKILGRHPLYVTPSATLEYLLPTPFCFDPTLLYVATNYINPSDTVWDIGANVGAFTIAAAHRANPGQILAVEADPWLAALLRRTTTLHGNRKLVIDVLCAAVGEATEINKFCIAEAGRASSFLLQTGGRDLTAGQSRFTLSVATVTLDSLLKSYSPPDFIKIDVEGAELLVLKGAQELLAETKPTLYIEVDEQNRAPVSDLLHDHGYKLLDIGPHRQPEIITQCVSNTLAVPPPATANN